jgi:hypothetical protein
MYPLKSILEVLLADIAQLPPGDRGESLCAMFARFLPQLSEPELRCVRGEVSRYWHLGAAVEALVDLIDGHLALRHLFSGMPMLGDRLSGQQDDRMTG